MQKCERECVEESHEENFGQIHAVECKKLLMQLRKRNLIKGIKTRGSFGEMADMEGVPTVVNILANQGRCDFIHSVNLPFIGQPTTEQMEGLLIAAHGFFTQLCATAIKHKFIGKPLKILTFKTKNTPVHWGDFDPIKQEYSLVGRKKFIGMKTAFYTYQSHLHCVGCPKEKAENLLHCNQKLATSEDFS